MASDGPRYPASLDGYGDVGTAAWTSGGSALGAPNDTYASTSLGAGQPSESLVLSNLGFAIPGGATVDGVVVDIQAKRTGGTANLSVQLSDGLAVIGTPKVLAVQTTEGTLSFGGAADKWGAAIGPPLVNSNGLGATLIATAGGSPSVVDVDSAGFTVFYTDATGGRGSTSIRLGLGLGLGGNSTGASGSVGS